MKTSLLLGTAALATVMAADAYAYDGGHTWYISGAVGANWADDDSFAFVTTLSGSFSSFTTTFAGTIDYDTGWAVAAAIGYRFDDPWRIELELSGRWNDLDSRFSGSFYSAAVSGDVQVTALLANIIYDFAISDRWNLSLGGGIGFGWVNYDATIAASFTTTFFPTTFTYTTRAAISNDDSGFAYQGIAGINYEAGERTDLFLEYRYFGVNDDNSNIVAGVDDYQAHTVWIGLRHYFNPAPAAEPAMEEPEVKTFIVFFDFNQSKLTREGKETIAEAAASYAATGSVHILVVGHTDTVGSAGYNQGLSERRAGSVKAELVRDGVPGDAVSTEGRGFSEPMVPTGPGVKEPQNRRAVIELQ